MATQAKYLLMLYLYKQGKKTDKINGKCSSISGVGSVITQNTSNNFRGYYRNK